MARVVKTQMQLLCKILHTFVLDIRRGFKEQKECCFFGVNSHKMVEGYLTGDEEPSRCHRTLLRHFLGSFL